MKQHLVKFSSLLGIDLAPVSHVERLASMAGGFISILILFIISQWFLHATAAAMLVASMGASAVLLFAVPHGQLSQPWNVFAGHLFSAFIGVTCAKLVSNDVLAASLAVGLAIGAMYYLRCIHPPGGATALTAVMGGETVREMGYQFLVTPVLINALIMLLVALLFNYLFYWRRYPVYLHQRKRKKTEPEVTGHADITHGDFVYALSQIDSFIDVSEYELLKIYEIATQRSHSKHLGASQIELGGYYSNGEFGEGWSVRHVVDESTSTDATKDIVVYKTVAGMGRRTSGFTSREEFARWARYRVIRDEENWKKLCEE